jgi:hypothetical protein
MKRWSVVVAAAAVAVMASSEAKADYQIIRWTSGFCQIWNLSFPMLPFPHDYRVISPRYKTFGEALRKQGELVRARKCL